MVGAGCIVIGDDSALALNGWIFGFAAVHLLLGGAAIRFGIHREIGSLLIGGGIGARRPSGSPTPSTAPPWWPPGRRWPPRSPTWRRASTARPSPALSDAERLLIGALGFLALAIAHMLVVEAPPVAIADGVEDLGASLVAIACCAGAALACWYWGREIEPKAGDGGGLRRRRRVRLPRFGR